MMHYQQVDYIYFSTNSKVLNKFLSNQKRGYVGKHACR